MSADRRNEMTMTLNELKQFFETYDKVESRIEEVAPLCTNICSCEEITGFSNCGDGDICVRVWSHNCGNDAYFFPLEYIAMEDDEIVECERKKEEKRRRLAEEERRKQRKWLEQQERSEYKRLKKKFEKGVNDGN